MVRYLFTAAGVAGLALASTALFAQNPSAPPTASGAASAPKPGCARPVYPLAEARALHEGTTKIRFTVSPEGLVVGTELLSSSGHVALDQAAIQALSGCSFKTRIVDGAPQGTTATVEYVWRLN